jgi:hypothetical protein
MKGKTRDNKIWRNWKCLELWAHSGPSGQEPCKHSHGGIYSRAFPLLWRNDRSIETRRNDNWISAGLAFFDHGIIGDECIYHSRTVQTVVSTEFGELFVEAPLKTTIMIARSVDKWMHQGDWGKIYSWIQRQQSIDLTSGVSFLNVIRTHTTTNAMYTHKSF